MTATGYAPARDHQLARQVRWVDGYRAGFTAGADIGAAGVLLVIQNAMPDGVLLDLLPRLPYTGEYQRLRRLREHTTDPCTRGCGSCLRCTYAAAALRNLARFGSPDYPGRPISWTVPTTADGHGAA